jgi:hypothetical protein
MRAIKAALDSRTAWLPAAALPRLRGLRMTRTRGSRIRRRISGEWSVEPLSTITSSRSLSVCLNTDWTAASTNAASL